MNSEHSLAIQCGESDIALATRTCRTAVQVAASATTDISIFQARIAEAEDCIDGLNAKVATTEKLRNRYQIDLEDLQVEYEKVTAQIAVAEKKLKTFDKVSTARAHSPPRAFNLIFSR